MSAHLLVFLNVGATCNEQDLLLANEEVIQVSEYILEEEYLTHSLVKADTESKPKSNHSRAD
jgi:hypothetical protein